MTWDPRDLGAPKRITQPPEPAAPPPPPPRSYELRLADWDDRRLTALTDSKPFLERIPEPECEEEVPLYAEALRAEVERSLYNSLLSKPRGQVRASELKDLMLGTIERVCEPTKLDWPSDMIMGSFKAIVAPPPEEGSFNVLPGAKANALMRTPVGTPVSQDGHPLGTVTHVERTPDGGALVRFRMGSAKAPNDAAIRYVHPTYPKLTPGMLDDNHRALVERPAQTLRDMSDAIQYGMMGATGPVEGARGSDRLPPGHAYRMNGPTGPCGPAGDLADWLEGDDYQGADRD